MNTVQIVIVVIGVLAFLGIGVLIIKSPFRDILGLSSEDDNSNKYIRRNKNSMRCTKNIALVLVFCIIAFGGLFGLIPTFSDSERRANNIKRLTLVLVICFIVFFVFME